MQTQNQTPIMKQPPTVISGKDLNYITDMLAWNLTAAKEAREFASKVTDQEVRQELETTYQMHKQHFERLQQFLSENTQTTTTTSNTNA